MAVRSTLILFALLTGPGYAGQQSGRTPNDAIVGSAATAGFDTSALEKLAADIESGQFTNTHAVLIEHDGALVFEKYFAGRDERFGRSLGTIAMSKDRLHDLRSISKSVTSALLGICLGSDARSAVKQPVGKYLPELKLDPARREITLHHILTMTTGLKWNEMDSSYADPANDAIRLYGVADPAKYLFSRPVVSEPGSAWYYNGGCTYVLGEIILKRTGLTIDEYAKEKLFKPLGITRFEWLGGGEWTTRNPSAAAGLRLTARDLTKIGSLYLNGGKWRGRRIVPKDWVELSTKRHVRDLGKWSGNGIWGYGYQWRVGKLPVGKKLAIAGAGNGNQRLFIVPEDKLVVTIFAGQYNLPFKPHSERILTRILQAHSRAPEKKSGQDRSTGNGLTTGLDNAQG